MTNTLPREQPSAAPATRGATKAAAKGGKKKNAEKGEKKSLLKSKKFLIGVFALLAVGGGAYKMLTPTKPGPPTGGDIVAMDPTTLNLADGHYLKLAVAIQVVQGKSTGTTFQSSHAAEIVIDEFSNRSVASLSTNAERQRLTADLASKIKAAYPGEVYAVYLTQFVTQ